ncbi:MAG: acyltransferase family protein [Paracoccaceae bacterium]
MRYRGEIDGLRAVAVASVVLYHFFPEAVPGGYVGVDVFFVISGFLITAILKRSFDDGTFAYADFYARRAKRLLPALLTVIAATAAAGWLLYLPGDLDALGWQIAAGALFVANIHFHRETGYFQAEEETQPLLHLWSLGVEEQFYIVLPALIAVVMRRRPDRLALAIAALALLSFAMSTLALARNPGAAFYLLPYRFWELGLGALLALAAPRLAALVGPARRREALAVAGLALVLAPVVLYDASTPFPGPAALAPCLGAALLIATGSASAVGRRLASAPMRGLGLVSYSLYLWHWPVLAFLSYYLVAPPGPLAAAGGVLASLGLAVLTWRFVETPIRRGRLAPGRARGLAGGALALTGALALALPAGGGWPGRFEALRHAGQPLALRDILTSCPRVRAPGADRRWSCAFGPGPARAVLWGDSHAGALMPGFAATLAGAGLPGAAVAKTACAPLLGIDRADRPATHRCAAHNAAVLDWIGETRPERVVLAARWALVATGTRPPGERGRTPRPVDVTDGRPFDFAAALERTVAALRATGAEVVLLAGVPEVGWNVPRVLRRLDLYGRPARPGPTPGRHAARNAGVEAALDRLARRPGVSVARPAEALCDAEGCRGEDARGFLYRDDDHLSAHGARLVADAVLHPLIAPAPARAADAR